jgi:hypothetical protein
VTPAFAADSDNRFQLWQEQGMVQLSVIISALGLLFPEEPVLAVSALLALSWLSRR